MKCHYRQTDRWTDRRMDKAKSRVAFATENLLTLFKTVLTSDFPPI